MQQPQQLSTQPHLEFICERGATPRTLKLLLARVWPKRSPRFAVVHVGSNNLGNLSAHNQRQELQSLWEFLPCVSEETEFIFSDILPKAGLRHVGDLTPHQSRKVDVVRRETNRFARRLSIRHGGRFIKHPSIQLSCEWLFRPDGIHLTDKGCQLLIQDWLKGPTFAQ